MGAVLPGALVTAFLSDRDPSILGIVLIIVPAFALTIYNWVLVHKQGQTIGKRALKIRIVKQDGSPCGFLHGVVLRDWVLHLLGRIPILGIMITLERVDSISRRRHPLCIDAGDVFACGACSPTSVGSAGSSPENAPCAGPRGASSVRHCQHALVNPLLIFGQDRRGPSRLTRAQRSPLAKNSLTRLAAGALARFSGEMNSCASALSPAKRPSSVKKSALLGPAAAARE